MAEKEQRIYTWNEKWTALKRQLGPHRSTLVILSILGVAAAAANGFVPYLTGRFLDALIQPHVIFTGIGPVPAWAVLLSLWAFIQILANGVSWINDRISSVFNLELEAGMQARSFAHLLVLPLQFHKTHRAGEISENMSRASYQLRDMAQTFLSLAPQLLTIIIGIVISFSLNATLAGVLLAGTGVYLLILVRLIPGLNKNTQEAHQLWNRAYGDAYDAYANIQTVKHAGAEEYEQGRIQSSYFSKIIPLWTKIDRTWNNIGFAQRVIVTATQGVIFLVSVYLIAQGRLTIGELIAFNAYAGMIIGPFVSLGNQWQSIQRGLVGIARAELVFGSDPEAYAPPDAVRLPEVRGEVEFRDVEFSYDSGQEVLRGMSFHTKPGEVVALVGETGAGKSTTVDLVSGYYFPTAGQVLVDGHDLAKVDLRDWRGAIAVVPQEVVLFNASVKDNIRYGRLEATDEEVIEAAKRAQAHLFIEAFPEKYEQEVGERGVKLSVGQKQRIAIARALLRDPKILILDEPTSALDSQTERLITKSLEELMKNRTTFIIAHRLSTVRKADRILVLVAGKVAEQGTHQELMAIEGGVYRRLYELHIGLSE